MTYLDYSDTILALRSAGDDGTKVARRVALLTPLTVLTIVLAPSDCGRTYSLDRIRPYALRKPRSKASDRELRLDALLSNEQQGRVNAIPHYFWLPFVDLAGVSLSAMKSVLRERADRL